MFFRVDAAQQVAEQERIKNFVLRNFQRVEVKRQINYSVRVQRAQKNSRAVQIAELQRQIFRLLAQVGTFQNRYRRQSFGRFGCLLTGFQFLCRGDNFVNLRGRHVRFDFGKFCGLSVVALFGKIFVGRQRHQNFVRIVQEIFLNQAFKIFFVNPAFERREIVFVTQINIRVAVVKPRFQKSQAVN